MMQIRGILLSTAAAVPLLVVASPLAAQSLTLDPPPVRLPLDENGVDLSTGAISVPSSTVAIGGAQGLQHTRFRVTNGWRHNYVITIAAGVVSGTSDQTREIDIGGSRVVFVKSGALYNPLYGDTGSLTEDSTSYTYTAGDGTVYNFSKSLVANGESYYGPVAGLATSIVSPGGAKTTLTYRNASYSVSGLTIYVVRLESVNNNAGYQLKYTYGANAPSSSNVDAWYRITRVTAINNAVQYCNPTIITANCNLTSNWPYLDYTVTTSGTDTLESVTDILGREARFRTDASSRLTGIKRPSEAADGVTITYNSSSKVSSITAPEGYSRTYAWATDPGGLLTSISNDALGRQRTVVTNTDQSVIESDTDALGHTTSYEYDAYGRVTAIVAPEGGRTEITRDARGRVTLVRRKAKPGTGLADITTSATYPALVSGTGYMMYCANGVTCDSPLTTTDARGKVTNYTYDQSTGALTEAKLPADSAGVRPATRYTYSARYARYLNSGGAVAQAATPIAVLDSVSTCRVGASCTGTADERVTEFTYPSGTGVSNLQPVSVTARSGDNSLTATSGLTYDAQGNQVTIDGPLAGSDDLVMRRYDAAGQLVGVVGPDPDGTGALPHLATRLTYNSDGQVKTKEVGSVTGLGDTEWAAFAPAMKYVTGYDAAGRVATNAQVHTSSSIQYNLTQYSYDVAGRPECAALRMNAPATTTVLPASACTPMTAGSYGEDRISRNYYDAADRVTETWSGIGTSLAQKTTKFAYTADGQVDWVEDAKGNRTGFTYDGFDRGTKVTYPSKTTPNTVNAADYEQVTYDAAGNVLTHRSRAGETFTFAYDNLGRVTSKDVPARSGLSSTHTRDVYYGYDLFGALTYARFDSATGEGLGFTYNALGQLTSSIQSLDGITRTLGYQYDAAGRRTRITFPDAAYWQYQYDKLGRFT
ncbi:MAG: RHS repeat protein, partial [Betaproteobacteria bacterium]|nr:RHS repeat protein [Betaproteobacteria bacterium]